MSQDLANRPLERDEIISVISTLGLSLSANDAVVTVIGDVVQPTLVGEHDFSTVAGILAYGQFVAKHASTPIYINEERVNEVVKTLLALVPEFIERDSNVADFIEVTASWEKYGYPIVASKTIHVLNGRKFADYGGVQEFDGNYCLSIYALHKCENAYAGVVKQLRQHKYMIFELFNSRYNGCV